AGPGIRPSCCTVTACAMPRTHCPELTMHTISTRDPRSTTHGFLREGGVTLIEMIMVIMITGILAAVSVVFLRGPVEGYVDVARRAELTDIADTALRRITRDLRTALPNSIRVTESP